MSEKSKPTTSKPELRELDINIIKPLENNPRKISKKDFAALIADIKADPNFLFQRPPLVDNRCGTYTCYAGNQRLKAARELGYTKIWCWVEVYVPDKLRDARMFKDNLHRGEWDMQKLFAFDASFLHDAGFKFGELSDRRRADYVVNDELISSKFGELFMKLQKIPSYEDIAAELQIDVSTVKRHVKDMDFKERFQRLRLMTDKVLLNVLKQATTGKNHHFARMWLELMEDLGGKTKVEVTGKDGAPLFKVYKGIDADKV